MYGVGDASISEHLLVFRAPCKGDGRSAPVHVRVTLRTSPRMQKYRMGRGQTDRQTDRQTNGHRNYYTESAPWADLVKKKRDLPRSPCLGVMFILLDTFIFTNRDEKLWFNSVFVVVKILFKILIKTTHICNRKKSETTLEKSFYLNINFCFHQIGPWAAVV